MPNGSGQGKTTPKKTAASPSKETQPTKNADSLHDHLDDGGLLDVDDLLATLNVASDDEDTCFDDSDSLRLRVPSVESSPSTTIEFDFDQWLDRALDALDEDRLNPSPFAFEYGRTDMYRLRYGKAATDEGVVYGAAVEALFNQTHEDGRPQHAVPEIVDSKATPSRGAYGVLWHPQVGKDAKRQPNQYVVGSDGQRNRIETTADEAPYETLADAIYAAARANSPSHAATLRTIDEADLRQRIAVALHTRTQTFEADATTVLSQRALEHHEGPRALTSRQIAHQYEIAGGDLRMTSYQVLHQRPADPEQHDSTEHLILVRRAGALDLLTGTLKDEDIFFSEAQPIDDTQKRDGHPYGLFVCRFGGGSEVVFEIGDLGVDGQSKPFFLAKDA